MGKSKWTPEELRELEDLKEDVLATKDKDELDDLNQEIIDCIARHSYRAAEDDLRKEYNLPSRDQEIERLKDEIYDLERRAAIRNSTMAVPRR